MGRPRARGGATDDENGRVRLSRSAVEARRMRMLNIQVFSDERPSNRSIPSTIAANVSCTESSAASPRCHVMPGNRQHRRVVADRKFGKRGLVARPESGHERLLACVDLTTHRLSALGSTAISDHTVLRGRLKTPRTDRSEAASQAPRSVAGDAEAVGEDRQSGLHGGARDRRSSFRRTNN